VIQLRKVTWLDAYAIPATFTKFFPGRAELPAAPVTQLAMETNHRLAKGFGVSIKRIEQARAELKIPEPKIIRERFKPLEDI